MVQGSGVSYFTWMEVLTQIAYNNIETFYLWHTLPKHDSQHPDKVLTMVNTSALNQQLTLASDTMRPKELSKWSQIFWLGFWKVANK